MWLNTLFYLVLFVIPSLVSRITTLSMSLLGLHMQMILGVPHHSGGGATHGQPTCHETCNIVFTMKWVPQYKRPQTMTKIRQDIHCPPDMSGGGVEFNGGWEVCTPPQCG